jgi:hypothetical protein
MSQILNDKVNDMLDSEIAQTIKDRMSNTFDPIKDKMTNTLDPKVSQMFTSCFVGTMDGENEYGSEESLRRQGKNVFAKMQGSLGKKFKCDGEDDAETIYTEAFGSQDFDESTYHEEYTTTDLNTVDEYNYIRRKTGILNENLNVSNGRSRSYGRSFKDRYVEMKTKQQFAENPTTKQRKPDLSINATEAVNQYDAAKKAEEQRRTEYAQQLAKKRSGTTPRTVQTPMRTPVDP